MSEIKDGFQVLGIDFSNGPDECVEVHNRIRPKVKCKNKILRWIFVRLFGYKIERSLNGW